MKKIILMLCLASAPAWAAGPYVLPPTVSPSPAVRPVTVTPAPAPVVVAPIVVHAPAVTSIPGQAPGQPRVWVPGRYVTQTLPDGRAQLVWVPGYWR